MLPTISGEGAHLHIGGDRLGIGPPGEGGACMGSKPLWGATPGSQRYLSSLHEICLHTSIPADKNLLSCMSSHASVPA